ncbi:DnaB-like helicase C terminal domain-containing protein [Desulfonatronum zhilinae]|nr:DnaB-like helicase C terminal domain-containing protein [Desulfonatronum zhilinae]
MSYREKLDTRLAELVNYPEISEEEGQKLLEAAREYSQRHRAHTVASQALKQLESLASPLAVLSDMKEKSQKILSSGSKSLQAVGNMAEDFLNYIEHGGLAIPTPFHGLNAVLPGNGLLIGTVTRLIAPPSAGKSDLATMCAEFVASMGIPVLYVMTEMRYYDAVIRGVSRFGGINSLKIHKLKSAQDEDLMSSFADACEKYFQTVGKHLFYVEVSGTATTYDIASYVSQIRKKLDLPEDSPFMVVIDYLQMLSTGNDNLDFGGQDTAKVTKLAGMDADLARENNVALLSISDITKDELSKSTSDKGMSLNSLRGSSRLSHNCDTVLFLYSEQAQAGSGKADSDPWELYSEGVKHRNLQDPVLEKLEKARKTYPPGGDAANAYARIELGKNRSGNKGFQLPIVYQKAYHRMIEIV